jgi:hypothetical protein
MYGILVGNTEGKRPLGDVSLGERIILKLILKRLE